jgi:hypothetical protein
LKVLPETFALVQADTLCDKPGRAEVCQRRQTADFPYSLETFKGSHMNTRKAITLSIVGTMLAVAGYEAHDHAISSSYRPYLRAALNGNVYMEDHEAYVREAQTAIRTTKDTATQAELDQYDADMHPESRKACHDEWKTVTEENAYIADKRRRM